MMSSNYLFYSRYIQDLSAEQAVNETFPWVGKSPFGGGVIEIDENGHYNCLTTDQKGTKSDFLKALSPLLTLAGIKRAIDSESKDTSVLHVGQYNTRQSKTKSEDYKMEFHDICSTPPPSGAGIWLDSISEDMYAYDLSPSNHPLCIYKWKVGQRNQYIMGTPRISGAGKAPRLWFVENHLEAQYLSSKTDEPVYVRPTLEALQWNDYQTLVQDKKVICLQGDERGDWEHSFYPLLECIQSHASTIITISLPPYTIGESLLGFLDTKGFQGLVDITSKRENDQSTIFNRASYQDYLSLQTSDDLYFPQDFKHGQYWYGTLEGNLIHSNPINQYSTSELENKYSLTSTAFTESGIRLTKSELFNIISSIHELTPLNTFEQIRKHLTRFVYLQHQELYSLLAIWILSTYIYNLFQAFPYLHFHGNKNSGKTTLMEIMTESGFNGILESQTTKASIIDTIHKTGATVGLDEFEEKSKGTEDQFVQMLKSGYRKGGNYTKMVGSIPTTLNVYSPKILSGESEIMNPALKSRTIEIQTQTNPLGDSLDIWEKEDPANQRVAQIIRRGGYALGLMHFKTIKQNYNRLPKEISLPNGGKVGARKRQLVAPLLATAMFLDTNLSKPWIEQEVLSAFEVVWDSQVTEHKKAETLFVELLAKWNKDSSFKKYKVDSKYLWISNKMWKGTELVEYLGSKDVVLKWFENLNGVKKGSTYFKYGGKNGESETCGCTCFPLNLKIKNTAVREVFSRKSP